MAGNYGWVENQIRSGALAPYQPGGTAGGPKYYAAPGLDYGSLAYAPKWEQGAYGYGPRAVGMGGVPMGGARKGRYQYTYHPGRARPQKQGRGRGTGNALMDVLTPITTQPLYSAEHTERGINQIYAEAAGEMALPHAMKRWDRPGVSRSPASESLAMTRGVVPAMAGSARGAEGMRISDRVANLQHLLQTESYGENIAQQMAGGHLRGEAGRESGQAMQMNALIALLRQLI